jgi:hypothetical protein
MAQQQQQQQQQQANWRQGLNQQHELLLYI